jgi:hypothetical protein
MYNEDPLQLHFDQKPSINSNKVHELSCVHPWETRRDETVSHTPPSSVELRSKSMTPEKTTHQPLKTG